MAAPRVIVIGGGVAGLTVAHELVDRGFSVEVYEARHDFGGKARSQFVRGTGKDGRHDLPGEHGFRFYPRFYRHVTGQMAKIPVGDRTVADHLKPTSEAAIALIDDGTWYRFSRKKLTTPYSVLESLEVFFQDLDFDAQDVAVFGAKLLQFATASDERRLAEYEQVSWYQFLAAEQCSEKFRNQLRGIPRMMVAMDSMRGSARTIGVITVQLLRDFSYNGVQNDRTLGGPTTQIWIDPWLAHLRRLGVRYHLDAEILGIDYHRGAIRSVTVGSQGRVSRVVGDHFVAALPVERLATLLTPAMIAADPALGKLSDLSEYTEWMNGIQFYLTEDRPLVHGHTVYMDSPWALTSISQAQFWPHVDLSKFGDGRVRGIISVCVSDWDVPGSNGKRADECTRDEIMAEVWKQLKESLNVGGEVVLRDDMLHHWFLDPAIEDTDPYRAGIETNAEPLLVNYVDTWRLRPEPASAIPNLFLASDYVRTTTDIATMEAANEAARRAVNGILAATGSRAEPCRLWNPYEPPVFAPWRAYDQARFDAGLPWEAPLDPEAHAALEAADGVLGMMPGRLRILSG